MTIVVKSVTVNEMTDFEKKVIRLFNITEENDPNLTQDEIDFWGKYMCIFLSDELHAIPVIVPRATYNTEDFKANKQYYESFIKEVLNK